MISSLSNGLVGSLGGTGTLDDMIQAARTVRARAYAPYSKFPVGACLRADSGRLHVGCNVENIAFPESLCAEANALGRMIAAGDRRVIEVVLIGGLDDSTSLCTPCGGCRQRLAEFADPETPIHICGAEGLRQTLTLGLLLPYGFRGWQEPLAAG